MFATFFDSNIIVISLSNSFIHFIGQHAVCSYIHLIGKNITKWTWKIETSPFLTGNIATFLMVNPQLSPWLSPFQTLRPGRPGDDECGQGWLSDDSLIVLGSYRSYDQYTVRFWCHFFHFHRFFWVFQVLLRVREARLGPLIVLLIAVTAINWKNRCPTHETQHGLILGGPVKPISWMVQLRA